MQTNFSYQMYNLLMDLNTLVVAKRFSNKKCVIVSLQETS
jgi:hypothetical protein